MIEEKNKKLNKGVWAAIGVIGALLVIFIGIISIKSEKGFLEQDGQFKASVVPTEVTFFEESKEIIPEEVRKVEGEEKSLYSSDWQEYLKFEGTGSEKTTLFLIRKNQWRIDSAITVPAEAVIRKGEVFAEIAIYKEGKAEPISVIKFDVGPEFVSGVQNTIFRVTGIPEGNANFYLEITTKESINWEIKVLIL